jgi:hypothetical protein
VYDDDVALSLNSVYIFTVIMHMLVYIYIQYIPVYTYIFLQTFTALGHTSHPNFEPQRTRTTNWQKTGETLLCGTIYVGVMKDRFRDYIILLWWDGWCA